MTKQNYVSVAGNLVRHPESKTVGSGAVIVKFDVAVTKKTKKNDNWEEENSFFTIKKWQDKNENLDLLKKGQKVRIIGELKQERWEKDGKNQSRVVIMANDISIVQNCYQKKEVQEEFQDDIPF